MWVGRRLRTYQDIHGSATGRGTGTQGLRSCCFLSPPRTPSPRSLHPSNNHWQAMAPKGPNSLGSSLLVLISILIRVRKFQFSKEKMHDPALLSLACFHARVQLSLGVVTIAMTWPLGLRLAVGAIY